MRTIISIILALLSYNLHSQPTIIAMINEDYLRLDKTFNRNITITKNEPEEVPIFKILKVDTIVYDIFRNEKYVNTLNVFKVMIKLDSTTIFNVPYNIVTKMRTDTLTYYIVEDDGSSDYFRLFGFQTSDIRRLFWGVLGRKKTKKEFVDHLVAQRILSKRGGREFLRSIRKNKFTYPPSLGKPCELLKYYYTEDQIYKASTIILPGEPFRQYFRWHSR